MAKPLPVKMTQTAHCARSASENDLADDDESCSFEDNRPIILEATPPLVKTLSTTLPRRLNRKKFKRRQIKDVKPEKTKQIVKSASSEGFFTRFFRTLGVFTGSTPKQAEYRRNHSNDNSYNAAIVASVVQVKKPNGVLKSATLPRPVTTAPKSLRAISASNNDIRSSSSVTDSNNPQSQLTKQPAESGGLCGLRNHGNTCFMNAVLQCLANTDSFSEYFVLDQFKVDLSRSAKKYGTKGQVTEQLALLLKSLWSCTYAPQISNKFKSLVAKHGNQYEGSLQHDAQEFLLWILDKVHEDLNVATKNKYKKPKSSHGRPDADVAAEMLNNYRRCNDSFVQDLFQAQFRSSLACPSCGKLSNTFDPYLCISLPIPHHQQRVIKVKLVADNQQQEIVNLPLDTECTLKELREKISAEHCIAEERLVLIELCPNGFQPSLSILDSLTTVQRELWAVQIPMRKSTNESGEQLTIVWVNQLKDEQIFGPVFTMSILREATYESIQKQMLDHMSAILKNNIPKEDLGVVFKLRVTNGFGPSENYIPNDVEHPLYTTCVEEALIPFGDQLFGPAHVKLVAEWDLDTKMTFMQTGSDVIESKDDQKLRATLHECFELYFMEEKLSLDDAWMCPGCKRLQQGTKKLSLWSTPDIFIVHLKRFRQNSTTQRTKLTTDISFPVNGLDVSPYVAVNRNSTNQSNPETTNQMLSQGVSGWSPWRRHRGTHRFERNEDAYDLYAVCNHSGSMQRGHYTAYCKNPVDGKWYCYDDLNVRCIPECQVVTSDAYILFYHRSGLLQTGSSSCSSSSGYSSTSSSSAASSLVNSEHWSFRMPPFHWNNNNKGSQSQDNLCDLDGVGSKTPQLGKRHFDRSQRAYSSLVPSFASNNIKTNAAPPTAELDRHSDDEIIPQKIVSTKFDTLPAKIMTNNIDPIAVDRPSTPPPPTPPTPVLVEQETEIPVQSFWTITSV